MTDTPLSITFRPYPARPELRSWLNSPPFVVCSPLRPCISKRAELEIAALQTGGPSGPRQQFSYACRQIGRAVACPCWFQLFIASQTSPWVERRKWRKCGLLSSMVASAGETNRDLAGKQFPKNCLPYNIIEFKKIIIIILWYFVIFSMFYSIKLYMYNVKSFKMISLKKYEWSFCIWRFAKFAWARYHSWLLWLGPMPNRHCKAATTLTNRRAHGMAEQISITATEVPSPKPFFAYSGVPLKIYPTVLAVSKQSSRPSL